MCDSCDQKSNSLVNRFDMKGYVRRVHCNSYIVLFHNDIYFSF